MNGENENILTINAGSSSIKFAVFKNAGELKLTVSGKIERIGLPGTSFTTKANNGVNKEEVGTSTFHDATVFLLDWMARQSWFKEVKAAGHRIVHGMKHACAEIINNDLIKEWNSIGKLDPDHLPAELAIIQRFRKKYPALLQVACFDTAFHTTIPAVAKTFAIPKYYFDEGMQRYGFHGISYSYLLEAVRSYDEATANGRIILAHLGNGASLAAIKEGKSVDTSMGFTPAGGIVMSTRSGDLDPGLAWYLMQKGMDAQAFSDLINHQSGLLGISGSSSDMQDLLLQQKDHQDAALAVDIFCYQVKKYIGGYAAALGGLDTLVFSGGIGENAPVIRSRICTGMDHLGIQLNEEKNMKNEWQISVNNSRVKVYVIPTDEERMIAKTTAALYNKQIP